jgi:hypothetical protein
MTSTRILLKKMRWCWLWRETLRPLYGPSAPVNVLLALFPLRSTLTVLTEPGNFALRISRREFCQEQQTDRRQTNAGSDALAGWNRAGTAGSKLHVEAATQYNSASQILSFTLFYLRNGELTRTKKVNMRCFFPEELMAVCRFNGLEVVQRYGDYDETPFSGNSPKQILFCRAGPH